MAKKPSSAARRRAARQRARRRRLLIGALVVLALIAVALLMALVMIRLWGRPADPAVPAELPALQTEPETESEPEPTPEPTPTPPATPEPMPTLAPPATPDPTPTPEPPRVEIEYPYALVVDRGKQVVTVLTVGETGKYDVIARQMICSTDKYNRKPTNGVYKLDGQRLRWLSTLVGSYAQYATRISATILFHSLPYDRKQEDAMMTEEYDKLGQNVSEGCVRLTCEDARWIYENVPDGTLVCFTTGERDEELLASLAPPPLVSGKWDPTDRNEDNPDYIGGSYHAEPVATPYPYLTPEPTKHKILQWQRPK